ncbi:hypothetical protein EV44_g4484 [Erysiphe necator]|uniref:CCHC-type domain-containing protein n=1 Tax=Uncinula necator TaxID=52586 RepID=A0A0B1P0B6_UNCNE|nr:hypothetical protein EV44_g4484 [Erysiphe necator]
MSFRVPDFPDTLALSSSAVNSFISFETSDVMNEIPGIQNTTNPLLEHNPSGSKNITLLPPHLWNLPYVTFSPELLEATTQHDPERVSQLFSSSNDPQTPNPPTSSQPRPYLPVQPITPYDGTPGNLRLFCSQLANRLQGNKSISEAEKVSFTYQCLGTGALSKMRSSFRCLEDPSIPPEIITLEGFLTALKQRCEDPSLRDQATTTVEGLFQKNIKFHEFITIFEDNMVDSIYSTVDKSHWKLMLERRLSSRLRNLILTASDVPTEYHAFVAYLRQKDAGLQDILATSRTGLSRHSIPITNPTPSFRPFPPPTPPQLHPQVQSQHLNLPVSQGDSAMDLDSISRQKDADGRLTQQAKDARRTLGRCVWCNKPGYIAKNCPLGTRTVATASVDTTPSLTEEIKDPLQQ